MAQFSVDSKVYVPATVVSLTESNEGTFYEIKLRAINKTTTLNVEESDIVARETTTTTPTETTTTEPTTDEPTEP